MDDNAIESFLKDYQGVLSMISFKLCEQFARIDLVDRCMQEGRTAIFQLCKSSKKDFTDFYLRKRVELRVISLLREEAKRSRMFKSLDDSPRKQMGYGESEDDTEELDISETIPEQDGYYLEKIRLERLKQAVSNERLRAALDRIRLGLPLKNAHSKILKYHSKELVKKWLIIKAAHSNPTFNKKKTKGA
ncbi:MAG: hypothetical protein RBG1_1C00001G0258 [candidate division Zixibacteria bacterium RBG-1]|nr:MAG: hypothetical protein RBG1_1C00001G0258 [candidate division Zixibacteria bacterium RBG-1]OGC85311.1 MAG: hypothetical protein A2V73_08440 [candidate division Zixibacteria bacterium RBG_19FT_COMBO_42_43]